MRSLLAILLLLLVILSGGVQELNAQDLTGQWTGSATDRSDKKQPLVLIFPKPNILVT
jgi:hypothetical protein